MAAPGTALNLPTNMFKILYRFMYFRRLHRISVFDKLVTHAFAVNTCRKRTIMRNNVHIYLVKQEVREEYHRDR